MKKIIIDGHNLIPSIGGFDLADPEDENKLTAMVSEYCRLARAKADLFFDGSPAGNSGTRRQGLVSVHYIRLGNIADDAIIQLLRREGNNARNLLVVSSDRRVQAEARGLHAVVISSEQFAQQMRSVLNSPAATRQMRENPPSEEEVAEMLKLMSGDCGDI